MLPKTLSPKSEQIIISIFFCCIAFGLVWQAIILSKSVPFHDWDEAIYAQVTKEFISHPSITLTYNGAPWFEKPPLLALYYGIAWVLPFPPELTARILSALLSIGSLLMLYAITRKIFAGTFISLIAVLVCIQSVMFIDRSILVNVDMLLTFGWLMYLWGMSNHNQYFRLVGLLVGVLSKSLFGFIPLIAELFFDILSKRLSARKIYFYISGIAAGSVWYIAMFVLHGKSFLLSHIYDHLISRVIKPIELHFGGRMYYVEKIWHETGILTIVACVGIGILLLSIIKRRDRNKDITMLSIIALPVVYFFILTFSKAKLHWYITPLIPFVGIGSASVFALVPRLRSQILRKGAFVCLIVLCVYTGFRFSQSVLTIPPGWYIPTEKTRIAQCIQPLLSLSDSSSRVLYLIPPQQRKDAQVIEAANLQIGSSFIYGSAPAFIYYVGKPVTFYYSPTKLYNDWQSQNTSGYSTIVVDESDLKDPQTRRVISAWSTKTAGVPDCSAGSLRAFIRDN